jgi:hypothetical protein
MHKACLRFVGAMKELWVELGLLSLWLLTAVVELESLEVFEVYPMLTRLQHIEQIEVK